MSEQQTTETPQTPGGQSDAKARGAVEREVLTPDPPGGVEGPAQNPTGWHVSPAEQMRDLAHGLRAGVHNLTQAGADQAASALEAYADSMDLKPSRLPRVVATFGAVILGAPPWLVLVGHHGAPISGALVLGLLVLALWGIWRKP
jgi:hypothetical protein